MTMNNKEINLLRNQLSDVIVKWAESYVTGCFIAEIDLSKKVCIKNTASISFINTGNVRLAVTNWHVIDKFRELRKESSTTIFQVGNLKIDPENYIIDENINKDLVTLNLNNFDEKNFQATYCSVDSWPPPRAQENDIVVFSGYPGNYVNRTNLPEITFDSVQYFELVKKVSDDRLVLHRNLERCLLIPKARNMNGLGKLGGFSGSLVLKVDQSKKISSLIPVAIIYQGIDNWQIQHARHLDVIDHFGKIR
jgi:hypothetical protein